MKKESSKRIIMFVDIEGHEYAMKKTATFQNLYNVAIMAGPIHWMENSLEHLTWTQ